jgi:hypothetical protein
MNLLTFHLSYMLVGNEKAESKLVTAHPGQGVVLPDGCAKSACCDP